MGRGCGICRVRRRYLLATSVALVVALFVVEPALAQLPLGSAPPDATPANGSVVGAVTQALPTDQVIEQVTPAVQEAAKPVAAVTESVGQTTAPATRDVAPIVAPVTRAVAPVAQAAAPALAAVQPVVQAAVPLLKTAESLTAPLTAPALEVTTSSLETTSLASVVTTPGDSGSVQATTGRVPEVTSLDSLLVAADAPTMPVTRERPAVVRGTGPTGLERRPSATLASPAAAPHASRVAHSAKAAPPRAHAPAVPRRPLGFLAAISAALASSAIPLLVALLTVFVYVAGPGLGRRIRPGAADWPLPIPLASLERPG
jgi:hypothetical protein